MYLAVFILEIIQNIVLVFLNPSIVREAHLAMTSTNAHEENITIPLICFYQQQLAEKERIPKAEEERQKRKSRCADAK